MIRSAAALLAITLTAPPALACSFCAGNIRTQQTLRMHYAAARAVLHGQLKNPRFDPKTDEGFTDLAVSSILKDDPARGGRATIVLHTYLPVVGKTPPDYLIFCNVANGALDPTFGLPASAAIVDYLKAAAKLDDKDAVAKLTFFFRHLDAADPTIAADAFFEFARASDADIVKVAKQLDAARVRKLIADPNTPPERLGVYSFLLGVTGDAKDAAYLAALLNQDPLPERAASRLWRTPRGLHPARAPGWLVVRGRRAGRSEAVVLGPPRHHRRGALSAIDARGGLQDRGVEVLRCPAAQRRPGRPGHRGFTPVGLLGFDG